MEKQTCRIILSNILPESSDPRQAVKRLARLFKISPAKASKLLAAEETVIKSGLDAAKAAAMAAAVRKAGFSCSIEKEAPPKKRFECPKCGYTCELDPDDGAGDICPSCQIVVQKFLDCQKKRMDTETVEPECREDAEGENGEGEGASQTDSVLPVGFFKFAKWGVTAFGALFFLFTGMTVFDMPSHEVMYALEAGTPICRGDPRLKYHPELAAYTLDKGIEMPCIKSYKMTVANSGFRPQLQTVVRFKLPEEIQDKMVDKPMFLDYDRAQRDVRWRQKGDIVSYALGPMKSMDQVTVRFKIVMDSNEDISWDSLIERVDVAEGDVLKGESPKLTMITRLLINLINIPGGSLKDQAKNITDVFLSGSDDDGDDISAEFDSTSADLAVSIESRGLPKKYYPGTTAHYSADIRVFNNGPGDAEEVRLIYSIPPDVEIREHTLLIDNYRPKMYEILQESRQPRRDFSKPPPGCISQDGEFICSIERIEHDSGATLHLRVRSSEPGMYIYEARAECRQSDPDYSNNDAVFEADLSVR